MEGGKELPIPKSMQNLDENSESLKNIKYKDQFLDVINTSNFKKNNEEKELKKNKWVDIITHRFMPSLALSTKTSFLVYQQPIVEQENRKMKRKHNKSKVVASKNKQTSDQCENQRDKEQAGAEYHP